MERTLWNKLQEAVDNNLSTRFLLIDRYGGIIKRRAYRVKHRRKRTLTGSIMRGCGGGWSMKKPLWSYMGRFLRMTDGMKICCCQRLKRWNVWKTV